MLERDARAANQEARERGENPAQAGWVDAGGEDEITGSEVPDVAGTQGGNGISSRYGE